jgi:hypothetical protein
MLELAYCFPETPRRLCAVCRQLAPDWGSRMAGLRLVTLAMPFALAACAASPSHEGSQSQFARSSPLASVRCANGNPVLQVINPTSSTVTVIGYSARPGGWNSRVLEESVPPGTASFNVLNETGYRYSASPWAQDDRRVSLRIDCR